MTKNLFERTEGESASQWLDRIAPQSCIGELRFNAYETRLIAEYYHQYCENDKRKVLGVRKEANGL